MRTDLRDDEPIEVQMAPLIDCVFLLIIFFLVATTLKKIDRELPLELPGAKTVLEVQQPAGFVAVAIDRNGGFHLDGSPVSIDLLQSGIRERARGNPDLKVRVDADRTIPFEKVMEVLDLLRFENLHNIGLNTRDDRPRAR
jgi:biopolymer transport protein ExbD